MFFVIYFFYATNPPLLFGLTCGFEPQISYPCVRLMQTKLLLVTSSHHHTISCIHTIEYLYQLWHCHSHLVGVKFGGCPSFLSRSIQTRLAA